MAMPFSLDQFYQHNRRTLTWLALAGMLWLLRDFFALVFLSFVLAFVALPVARFIQRLMRVPYRLSLAGVYLLFLAALASFAAVVTPNVIREANRLMERLGDIEQTLVALKSDFLAQYPSLERPFVGYLRSALDDQSLARVDERLDRAAQQMGLQEDGPETNEHSVNHGNPPDDATRRYRVLEENLLLEHVLAKQRARIREQVPRLINLLYRTTVTTLLALLLSFLVLVDLERLRKHVRSLQSSRLHDLYEDAAQPVLRFTYVVGRAIQAQAAIAVVNTSLTAVGLSLLQIPLLTMLSLVVFVCSFIPVLGVFISTTPILLVALNAGGVDKALGVVALVVLVHAVESYVLNPWIYGRHLNLNPVLVLIVLLVGYHLFGIWGMVLGVPVALYLLHDVFGVPLWGEEGLPAPEE
jgi:predicted PurR-regulated permease PerM